MTTPLVDVKQGRAGGKPDLTHVRRSFMIYTSRPGEYGTDKYERANYLRPTGGAAHSEPTADDFERFREYLRASISHATAVLDAMEMHQATDPQLRDVAGMKLAAYARDTDTKPGDKVGPSNLPHVAPACTSLMMAIQQAINCGLLPADPGAPWREPAGATHYTHDNGCVIAIARKVGGLRCYDPAEVKVTYSVTGEQLQLQYEVQ